jgi:predicted amidohydrolase YtcJ
MRLDALFVGGRFTTLDPARPTASSLGVLGGLVVGFDEELEGCDPERFHDLAGAPVVPGFHDAHHHLSAHGQELRQCDVSASRVSTLEELYGTVGAYAATLPPDSWVLAAGYDDGKLGGHPEREGLDAASGGRPVWMVHTSHHAGVVNTEAIRRMGYADPRDLPDDESGVVERRSDGSPTGYLAEGALDLVYRVVRPAPFEEFVAAIGAGSRAALEAGLTSVTEPGLGGTLTGNGVQDLAAFQEARERGLLGVRMTVMPEMAALHVLDSGDQSAWFGLDLGLRSGLGDDHLRIGGVKLFSDGALTARTAAVCEEYVDPPGGHGFLHQDPDALREAILAAHRHGWQVATHAIGDRAVETVLDAYEEAQRVHPRDDPRHRIEHCGIVSDEQIARIKRIGVIPVPQARFLSELGEAYLQAIGRERGQLLYRQRSLVDAGIEVPGSSDCPVVSGAPLLGIHALVNRELPDGSTLNRAECLTPAQALRAFTYGSAYADHQENRKGTLSRGKLADFVVLSDDLLAVDPQRIRDLSVQATVVGGAVGFGEDVLAPR